MMSYLICTHNISVILPAHNEEHNILPLYNSLKYYLDGLGVEYEIIFIDDYSSDNTRKIFEHLSAADKHIHYISLNRRSGQTQALANGLKIAKYELIVTMDSDLQHNPRYIKDFFKKIDEGYDMVLGWRKERKGPYIYKKIISSLGNKIVNTLCGTKFNDVFTPYRMFKKELIKGRNLYSGYHRFLPIIFSPGAKIYEFPITSERRKFDKSKYTILKGFNFLLSLFYFIFFDKENKVIFKHKKRE